MIRLSLLMMCLFGLPNCMAHAAVPAAAQVVANASDEAAERNAIFDKVRAAIAASDFVTLSAMDDDFRSSRARTSSGVWKLAVLHAGLQSYLAEGLRREDGCQYRDAQFVQRWATTAPRSPAPVITEAALLLEQAWCARGHGFADSVADEAWPRFRQGVAAASATLAKHRRSASADPEFYAVELNVILAQGADKATFDKVLTVATAREPYYHRTYVNAAWSYLPQWGGSYAALEAFARHAADLTRADEGGGLYARIFWSLEECGCRVIERAADWPTMKQAMQDVFDRHPTRWNGEYFANLSCRMGDGEEGRRFVRANHPGVTDDASFAALFASCDQQARAGR